MPVTAAPTARRTALSNLSALTDHGRGSRSRASQSAANPSHRPAVAIAALTASRNSASSERWAKKDRAAAS
jgi:hypothetical protein